VSDEDDGPEEIFADTFTFRNEKSPDFKTAAIDGVYGSLTTKGKLFVSFYTVRSEIPSEQSYEISDEGQIDQELESNEDEGGAVREFQFGGVMDLDEARSIAEWLMEQVELYEEVTEEMSSNEGEDT